MKKIFAFAMALVSMAAVMTSCNNDDAEFVEQKAPTTAVVQEQAPKEMKDISLVVAVTPEQKNYFDDTYTIQMGGKVMTVKVSEMESASKEEIRAFANVTELADAFETYDIEFYSFKLGKVTSFGSAKILSRNLEAKANHPAEQFNFMNAAGLYFNGMVVSPKMDLRLFEDLYATDEDMEGFAYVLNQYSK